MVYRHLFLFQHILSFLLLFKLCGAIKLETDPELLNCKEVYTYGYKYTTFYRLPPRLEKKELSFNFYVKAKSDAHILFSIEDELHPLDSIQPVYEIVLGAGKNTFSDIRRSRRSATMTTANTPALLSQYELRGFWIVITSDGHIEVGKKDENIPFMFWQDTNPLPVRYFSFSTWTDVFGRWRFDCNASGKGTSSIVLKPTTWVDRLKGDVLKSYDPQVIPKEIVNERLGIEARFECRHIELDSKKAEITVNGIFTMTWVDEKLRWESSKYGGVKALQLRRGEIWRPEIFLHNSVGHGADPFDISGVMVNSYGEVTWAPKTTLHAHCKLDLSAWPWDQHTCKLVLGFWSLKDFLKLELSRNETKLSNQKSTSQWKIVSVESEITSVNSSWYREDESDGVGGEARNVSAHPTDTAVLITITLKRISSIYSYALLVPLIVNVGICMFSFGLSPVSPVKIGMLCVCLVLDSMFIIAVDNTLPSTAQHAPYIFRAYSESMIIVTMVTVVSVLLLDMLRRPHLKPPHPIVCNLLNWPPLKLALFLPDSDSTGLDKYDELNNTSNGSADEKSSFYEWTLLATAIDRVALGVTCICIAHTIIFSS